MKTKKEPKALLKKYLLQYQDLSTEIDLRMREKAQITTWMGEYLKKSAPSLRHDNYMHSIIGGILTNGKWNSTIFVGTSSLKKVGKWFYPLKDEWGAEVQIRDLKNGHFNIEISML